MAASTDVKDLYKAIVLLQSLPPSFNRTKTGGFAKTLAAVGESDNKIGGLFGKANFLVETAIESTIETLTGLSNQANGLPPGTLPPPGDMISFTTPGAFWNATLTAKTSDARYFSFSAFEAAPSGIDIRDNFYFDGAVWQPLAGCVGVLIGASGFAMTQTVASLEAALNATSTLLRVSVADVTNAALIFEEQTPKVGVFVIVGQDRSAVNQARDSMLLNTAVGKALTDLGANYGVVRPPQSPFDDELFRRVIPILAWLPKTPYLVPYRLAEAIFGTQAQVLADVGYTWQFYEVNPNEIIFECPVDLIAGNTTIAGYMHGYPGNTQAVTGPTNTFTAIGPDARLAVSGNNLTGRTVYIFHTGAWQTYTISSSTYNAGTQTNTIVVSAATIPTGNNYPFFIDVPGANSWNPGDFMLSDATLAAGGLNPPSDTLVYLFGKARLDIFEFYMNQFVRAAGVSLRSEVL